MDIIELKEAITKDTLSDDFMIFTCEDNYFLADQYISEICRIRNMDRVGIDSIDDCLKTRNELLENPKLYVVKTDTFITERTDFSNLTNIIVVCKAIGKKVNAKAKDYEIKFPKPVDWQVADYIRMNCSGLTEADALDLYAATNRDIYKTNVVLDQLKLFDGKDRLGLLRVLLKELHEEYYVSNYYAVAEQIALRNKAAILDFLKHYEASGLDAFYLYTIVLDNLKKALFVQYTNWNSCSDLKLTPNQVHAIGQKYSKAAWPMKELQEAIHRLASIDFDYKAGRIDLDKKKFLDYIICKLLA